MAAFLETLDRLPPYYGPTLRGCPAEARFVRDGQSVVTQGLVSTSRNLEVATESRTAPALYAVLTRTGRDISQFSAKRDEQEVVLLPGTVLYLAETRSMADTDIRLVFEVEVEDGSVQQVPVEVRDRFYAEIERFLEARLSAPAVSVQSIPGKFCGDIS